ncbi:hypothetical protein AVEN_104284-1 [Araneus ventricosus]|uniref:Tc1-like transposase DDE domain-containing protein n=1 Tax=Araneus ventricosus TaxID=182803 RepID=A0A4Y2SA68_ARAVE|nr:hypothetical protein AVEN_134009-1 [Araneus ventricosus]GBN85140.1 hypothetical protein AVEN_104284-1 [Araneus ventricosus]
MCIGILYQNLKKSIIYFSVGRWYIFQINNDPKQTSKTFTKNKIKIQEWPPQSSNLNPIKKLWSVLHQKLPFEERRSKNKFFERIKDEWRSINQEAAKKLIDNLNRRLKTVIVAKEGPDKH